MTAENGRDSTRYPAATALATRRNLQADARIHENQHAFAIN
jgi:hypothetical protein